MGLIRVVTLSDQEEIHGHGALIEAAFPGLEVVSKCIEDQPEGIHDEKTERLSKPKIIRLAKQLEREVEAIIVSCAADPAVEELRKGLHIPIIGAGRSLAAIARTLGDSIGVITITDEIPYPVKVGLNGVYLIWIKIEGVKTTLDLREDGAAAHTLEAARHLKEQGCNVIALACTGFSTIDAAPKISKELGIPVVDPVLAAGSAAYNLLNKGFEKIQ